jgi:alkanesulfonate monooxygenase SsuD/methylene tetrahydromethanopterin reductase-like flavin-dependent oxidoreductase (luciferase family)
MSIFAAAALRTKNVQLGTRIIPTWPRHPLALAGEAATISLLSGGRFRLGVGPSHVPQMKGTWGIDLVRPLHHLREYLAVANGLLKKGEVDFDGDIFHVHVKVPEVTNAPVMISALRSGSFKLAAEATDGAITWVTPIEYVRRVALPLMRETATAANRPAPPVIFHAPVIVETDKAAVAEAARSRLAVYPRLPFYRAMFQAAGFDVHNESWSDEMIDAVVISGDEDTVVARLKGLIADGVGEVIAMPIGGREAVEKSWNAIAKAAKR